MGGKHLKRLRAEKSKVQLKKKKLSKAQNVTNTTFTVKKISTVRQLQKVEKDEPVSNWNVPLKDLLTRLGHYNFTSRLNSLTGIKELLGKHPEIVRGPSLKPLMTRLLLVIADEEHKIRVTAFDLLVNLFELMSSSSVTAFYEILNLHLGCAMTHRNIAIQQDSLKLIDILVKYSPGAIKCNFKAVMQNFLRILKSYLYESHAGMFSSGKSKQDLEKRKREMLCSFYEFLVAGYSEFAEQNLCKSQDRNINIKVLGNEKLYMRDLFIFYKQIPQLSIFKNSDNKERLLSNFNAEDFISLCSNIIPLIFDVWSEFFPEQKHNEFTSECELSECLGELLSTLLKILLFLYEITGTSQDRALENWFVSNYSSAFKKAFTLNFPYFPSMHTKKSTGVDSCEFARKTGYFMQNLTICYLSYSFKIISRDSILEKKVENYVTGAMTMCNAADNKILLKVIEAGIYASQYKKSNIILHKAVEVYDAIANPEFQQSLSKILMKLVLEENENLIERDECLRNWIKSLPHCLCKSEVHVEELETILKLINTSKGADLLKEIELKAEEILDNVKNFTLNDTSYFKGHMVTADILYRCNRTVLMKIMNKKIFGKGLYNQDFENYIVDIFSHKINKLC